MIGLGAVQQNVKAAKRGVMVAGTSGEYYGFALFIFATVAMILWTLWAVTPDRLLRKLGIDWYPNRYVSAESKNSPA